MRKSMVILLSALVIFAAAGAAAAREMRLAYVDSDRILEANDDYRQAKQKLQEEERQYLNQATQMEETVKSMGEELQAQSLMLSEEARKERENRFMEKQQELDKFRKETWGEGGKLYARNLELSKPILDKINTVIQKLSREAGYDFVFDAASANIVFALPEYDITEKVLDELKKE
jgi:outer membrane protein